MKLKFKLEEFLINQSRCCMQRFKAGTILENVHFEDCVFYNSSMPKKAFYVQHPNGMMRFEEWEPGVFEKVFEIL